MTSFAFRFDRPSRLLQGPIGLGPSMSRIDVDGSELRVHMGWGFRTTVSLTSVRSATAGPASVLSRGVHGWRGRWLVNGAGSGLVTIRIDPPARAYTLGIPVKLRELIVSVDEPDALIAALVAP